MSNLAKYRFYFNNDKLAFKARKSSRKSSRKVSKRTSSKKVSKRTSSKKVSKRKSSRKVSKRTSSKKVSKRTSSKRTSSKTNTCSSRNKNNCDDDKCHWQKYNGCKNRRSKSIRRLNELMAGDVPKFFQDKYQAKKAKVMKQRADDKQKENSSSGRLKTRVVQPHESGFGTLTTHHAVAVEDEQVADDDAAKMAKLGADAGLWFKSRKSSKRKSSKRKSSTKNRANRRTIEADDCINRSGNEQLCGYEPNCEWVAPTQSCRLRKLSRSSRGKVAYEGPMGPPLAFKSKKSRKSGKKSRKSRKSGKKSRKMRKSGKKSRKMRKVRKVSRK